MEWEPPQYPQRPRSALRAFSAEVNLPSLLSSLSRSLLFLLVEEGFELRSKFDEDLGLVVALRLCFD